MRSLSCSLTFPVLPFATIEIASARMPGGVSGEEAFRTLLIAAVIGGILLLLRRFFGHLFGGTASDSHRGLDKPEKHRGRIKTDLKRLRKYGLPILRNPHELAAWLDISPSRLRWFTINKPVEQVSHYVRFKRPKRGGGERIILAPKRELKQLQRQVLREILERLPVSEVAHGFVAGRSIVTNARPHVGKRVVVNLDLQDFFPSITLARVRGVFTNLGYSYRVASILALLCTEYERKMHDKGGQLAYVSVGPRTLVQGAPTSPALANLVAWKLDRRLAGLAHKLGFTYTRYADDLTFSGDQAWLAPALVGLVRHIVAEEGFAINPAKTRIFRRSSKQVVTGLVVNDRVNTPRELRRKIRAILTNAKHTGLQAQNREDHPHFRRYLAGLISFIYAANPEHALRLKAQLASVPD
ncbi:MAG: reverse transcriptase family protein [Candidatus Zipacnadales bacterium]